MRTFLDDYRNIITFAELQDAFENDKDDFGNAPKDYYLNINQWLNELLSKNGTLTEIKTDDTPKGQYAVTLYQVQYSDDTDDICDEWLDDKDVEYHLWMNHKLTKI